MPESHRGHRRPRRASLARVAAWALGLATAAGGCSYHASLEASAIVVYEEPPPERAEDPPPPPSPDAVWAAGHWRWGGGEGWRWAEGRWLPARPGQVYIQAHWERRGRGWVYVPGRFRPVE